MSSQDPKEGPVHHPDRNPLAAWFGHQHCSDPKVRTAEKDYTRTQRRMIDARLDRSDADIKAGRTYGPFATAEEMAASIEAAIKKLELKRV